MTETPRSTSTPATVFDLDGTLADSVDIIGDTLFLTLAEAGHEVRQSDIRSMIGRPLEVVLTRLTGYPEDHDDIARMVKAYRAAYFPAVEEAGPSLLIPGVPAMLERLRAAGHSIGVVTAKSTRGAEHLLELIGIRHLIDVLVGTERVAYGKPAPDSGLLALSELEATAGSTWYVGDATSDMVMALAAGMRPLGVTMGVEGRAALLEAGAAAVADSPDEVAEIVLGTARKID